MKGSIEYSLRRDRMYIMAEILKAALDGSLKTQLIHKANLSFSQLNDYLALLLDLKLLEIVENNKRMIFKTTNKGMRYLQSYREIREFLKNEFGHSNPDPKNRDGSVYLVKRGSQVICRKGSF